MTLRSAAGPAPLQTNAVTIIASGGRDGTYSTVFTGYAMSLETAMPKKFDLGCDLAVCAVDNNQARITASQYFRQRNNPIIFTAVSADTDHGYVFVQEPAGSCIGCLFPDINEDKLSPCPGTSAIADILQSMGALVTYAIDSILMDRKCLWNYRAIHLCSGEWDAASLVSRHNACTLCAQKESQ